MTLAEHIGIAQLIFYYSFAAGMIALIGASIYDVKKNHWKKTDAEV